VGPNSYAVIRTGGKQYRVEPGFELLVEKLPAEEGQALTLTDVLLYSDGAAVSIGKPILSVVVHAKCLGHEMGPKLRTVKYKRRHNYRRTYGHRQNYTRLLIEKFESKAN